MFSEETNDLLTLLAFTIFADKRIYASEVQAFMSAAQTLPHFQTNDIKISEARLLAWFEENRLPLRKMHHSVDFGPWFTALLGRLRGIENKNAILKAMEEIAVADDEIHVSEKALVALVRQHWSLPMRAA